MKITPNLAVEWDATEAGFARLPRAPDRER